ncbi:hypothetical protein MAR_027054 [Mya arenaria]|uniref:Proline-rich transmembrane protein 3/4 domain-containing protein n=1 Tax=Mya arenaria TaxID=6604 RepID=A0ABY7EWS9_MYAAR|nr:uncharacterized protein LOC128244758 [Mya arenaria]XP_052818779.1 uncharacterized protein LOC128244758 [Mya arenaria]WAR12874.1 hypothetical protein MAR_027054 [Mya arenaria]
MPVAEGTPEGEAEVGPEPEKEISPEPEVETGPEPETEIYPEPEVETEPEGEYDGEVGRAEAEPDWPLAFKQWGPAWQLHVYFFASIFMCIAILSLMSMTFYLRDRRRLRQGILTFTLQCLLFLFTLLRTLSLFINPYLTVYANEETAFTFLWSLALPSLTAAFSVLLLVFLDTTKMTLGPPIFQKLPVLLGITAAHFLIVMMSEVVCYVTPGSCKPMLMFCQCLFVLYGLLLGAGYLYTAIVVHRKCSSGALNSDQDKIRRIIKISAAASITAFSVAITHVYSACSEFGIYSNVTYVDAWSWWTLQTLLRLEELSSACIILVIAFRNPLDVDSKVYTWLMGVMKTSKVASSDNEKNKPPISSNLPHNVKYTDVEKF